MSVLARIPVFASATLLVLAVGSAAVAGPHVPCLRRSEFRNPYFGDLHVHTAYSQDASTQGTRNRPRDAYRFARGEPMGIQPYDGSGRALRTLQLSRPLDFAAVTDHAEQLGETRICQTPELPGYDAWVCRLYRYWPRAAFFVMNTRAANSRSPLRFAFCGDSGSNCREAARTPWRDIISSAEAAYDRTEACSFTTFVGYEWTAAPGSNNLHRNVIFADEQTTDLPISYFEAKSPESLWRQLREQCTDAGNGCDAVVIPHNSNLSGGLMFQNVDANRAPIDAAYASERARFEQLVEVIQHKGDSECLLSPTTTDELCDFEKLPYSNFRGKYVRGLRRPPEAAGFVRDALKQGLAEEARLGVNPFKLGMIGSTDTHLGAAGAADEDRFAGHGGAGVPARDAIPPGLPDEIEFNPGGLAVLYAEENTRESLFAAMKRREAYGTSGPRLLVRFFGGWEYPDDLCTATTNLVEVGYGGGVPMGGDLPAPPRDVDAAQGPRFVVWAFSDISRLRPPPTPVARLQGVKGWRDTGGALHEKVYDRAVAPNASTPVTTDPATCQTTGRGPPNLCSVWADPDFHRDEHAFYYARVLESPTCRWSQRLCVAAGVRCGDKSTIGEGFEPCCADDHTPLIQERAWTSPIWYRPANAERASLTPQTSETAP
jgi:hypothetical protein